MPSPFPGMDPHVESDFGGLQVMLIAAIAQQLNRSLPPGLVARPERQVWLEEVGGERLATFVPDASVVKWKAGADSPAPAGGAAVAELVATPSIRVRPLQTERQRTWLEITDARSGGALITAVEVLSPSNKRAGEDRDAYLRKVADYRRAGVNLVEIDLLRIPRRQFWFRWEQLPKRERKDYLVAVWRSGTGEVEAYPAGLRDRLPVVLVPLRASDVDAKLDVQAAFAWAYSAGGFETTDYAAPVAPPLKGDDVAWAAELLKTLPK